MQRKPPASLALPLLAAILTIAAVLPAAAGQDGARRGFATPEAAVRSLVASLGQGDFAAALTHFDSPEAASRFRFDAYAMRLRNVWRQGLGPYRELNQTHAVAEAAEQIQSLVYRLLLPEKYDQLFDEHNASLALAPGGEREFAAALDLQRLRGLRLAELLLREPEADTPDLVWGSAALARGVIAYALDSEYFVGGVELSEYDGVWFIRRLYCPVCRHEGAPPAVPLVNPEGRPIGELLGKMFK